MPYLPPWLKPADEAAQTAHGFQIGMQLGAQQAAQQHAAEQMQFEKQKEDFIQQTTLRQMQLKAIEDAREQAKFGLEAAAASKKADALMGYQQAVRNGMPVEQAIQQFGPGMSGGLTPAFGSAMRAAQPPPGPPQFTTDPSSGITAATYGGRMSLVRPPPKAKPNHVHVGNKIVDMDTGDIVFDGDKDKWSKEDTMKWQQASREMIAAQHALATPFIASDPEKAKEAQTAAAAAKRDRDAIDAKYGPQGTTTPHKRFKWDKAAGKLVPAQTPVQPQAVPATGASDEESDPEEE